MKGQRLIRDINAIRRCQGMDPLLRLPLAGTHLRDSARCAVAAAIAGELTVGSYPPLNRRYVYVLRFDSAEVARAVAGELGQPLAEDPHDVVAPPHIYSFMCAFDYGLIFRDADGFLAGWIDPTDADRSVWNLHLMPGHTYPPGHEPRDKQPETTIELLRPMSASRPPLPTQLECHGRTRRRALRAERRIRRR